MVEATLLELYQYYNRMKYLGSYSIFEVDSMLPFEREIYFSLLSKSIEESK